MTRERGCVEEGAREDGESRGGGVIEYLDDRLNLRRKRDC